MQDGCKVYMDSYMASIGSCSMVTWTIFKNHLLEIGLTQNRHIRGSVATLHDFGGVLGRPLDTFFEALTISRSWLLVRL